MSSDGKEKLFVFGKEPKTPIEKLVAALIKFKMAYGDFNREDDDEELGELHKALIRLDSALLL